MSKLANKGATKAARPRLVPGLDVRAGDTLAGKYRVEQCLAAGTSGIVLAAHHVRLREEVTLKILAAYTDEEAGAAEKRLARVRKAARLRNPHVARIVDVGTTEQGMPFVATERLAGRTLEAELDERGPLPVAEAVLWVLETCEALAEAHAAGLVHRDLKPSNLFLAYPRPQGSREKMRSLTSGGATVTDRVLKVLDFGMTSPLEGASDPSASAWSASPAYLAPEQIRQPDDVDARADIWALGVILYELLSCELPFTAETLSGVLVAVCFDAAPLLTQAPYELAKVISRCLEKDRDRRPRDVLELAREIARFAGPAGARAADRVEATLKAGASARVDEGEDEDETEGAAASAEREKNEKEKKKESAAASEQGVSSSASVAATTAASQRVLARRRRLGVASLVLVGCALVVGLSELWTMASPTSSLPASSSSPSASSRWPLDPSATDDEAPLVPRAPMAVPPHVVPTMREEPPAAVDPKPAAYPSSSDRDGVPVRSLPAAAPPPPRPPAYFRPAPAAAPATSSAVVVRPRLPAGLPSTREPGRRLPPSTPPPPPPSGRGLFDEPQ